MMNNTQNNEKRFVYFYLNRDEPERIRQVVATHVGYWQTANVSEYIGGPFGDRTGGLISFIASDLETATDIILRDPFIVQDLIAQHWIKEWVPE